MPVIADITQLTLFMDFIEKSANRECPGGLYGCAVNGETDMRCRIGAKYFLDKNTLTDRGLLTCPQSIHLTYLLLISSFLFRFFTL